MDQKIKVSVIGGDTRQVYAADTLKSYGYDIAVCGFSCFNSFPLLHPQVSLESAAAADVVILPLPYSRNNKTLFAPFADSPLTISSVFEKFCSGQQVFLGNADDKTITRLSLRGARVCDYYRDEALTLYNARLTAEALLSLVIEKLLCSLQDMEVALAGFGRVAFYTAQLLHLCGARVTVIARAPLQLAKAKTAGYKTVPLDSFSNSKAKFDCLINTIPARVFTEQSLATLNRDCLLIEAASAPYGIDADAAQKMGFVLYKAFSLPGKVSPKSAGIAIAQTIHKRIRR